MDHRYKRRKPMGEINVVPYIDVSLVLLVIFMITAPMLSQGVKVKLPQAAAQTVKPAKQPPLVVTVDAAGRYYLEYGTTPPEQVDDQQLAVHVAALIKLHPGTPVYVKGDRQVAYGTVVAAMALLQHAGVPQVGLLTEPPKREAR